MGFSINLIVLVVTILFTAAPIRACEQSCRDGISLAFCNSYAQEWQPLFDNFSKSLTTNLYNGTSDGNDQVINAVNTSVSKQVNKLQTDFTRSCPSIVQDSIFSHEPKFKGQCQKPLRVIQPKPGVNWTLSDCQNQDYICGNPPSICHFMDQIVKPRNVKLLKESLSSHASADGDFTSTITLVIEDAVTRSGAFGNDTSKLNSFMGTITKNLRTELDQFDKDFNDNFCFTKSDSTTSCDKYDDGIKSLLLSFP